MRTDKKEVFELRKQGKTYNEISKTLGISKGTLSFWFKNFDWASDLSKLNHTFSYSPEKLERMREARRTQLDNLYARSTEEAHAEFEKHKNETLFIAGLMVYAGEGDHSLKNNLVRITNSVPEIVLIFKRFIQKYHSEIFPKIRASVLLYPDLDDEECLEWWSKSIEIPRHQFYKPVRIVGRHKTRRLRYGVGSLIIGSKSFKVKLLELQNLALKNTRV